jgi:hypothetical protein
VDELGDMVDMLIGAYQGMTMRISSLEDRMDDEEALSEEFSNDISDL